MKVIAMIVSLVMVITAVILVSFVLASPTLASTKIAFLEVYEHGKLVQYEPGSRFGHSAMQIGNAKNNLWLQSYPDEGVKLITWRELNSRGKVAAILEIPVDVTEAQIKPFIGKPFDFDYTWSDDAFYCSELLGKILQIPPEPMHFNHAVWPKWYWSKEGTPGLSPDGIYQYLKQKYSL